MFLIGPFSAVARQGLVPLAFAVVLTLAFLAPVRTAWRGLSQHQLLHFALPILLWTFAANFWAPTLNIGPWVQMILTIMAGMLVATGLNALDAHASERIAKSTLVGGILLLVFLLEESMSKAAFLSWVRPEDVQNSAETFFSLIMSLAARGTSVLAITTVMFASLIYVLTRSAVLAVVFAVAALWACARLPMTTSALAVACAVVAFVLVYLRPRLFMGLLLAGVGVVILAAGPASRLIPSPTTMPAAQSQLELGVQHRLSIWQHVGALAAEHPVVGQGYNAARFFAARQDKIESTGLPALPTHPHNAPLQIWLELGGLGALLAVVFLVGTWRAMQPLCPRPFHAAVVAGVMAPVAVVACFSYAIWSTWWIAALGLAAGLCALTLKQLPARLTD